MSKLYVGNLPAEADEAALRQLLQEHGLEASSVLVKRGGYAFIDFPEQSAIQRAIETLNGYEFMGSTLVVEPSVAGSGRRSLSSKTVHLSNVGSHVQDEQLERLLTPYGKIIKLNRITLSRDQDSAEEEPGTKTYEAVFEAPEEAEKAVADLNGTEFEGHCLYVEIAMERGAGGARGPRTGPRPGQGPSGYPVGPQGQRHSDFPLRILVASDMVGAIIGRQGGTIRQITQQTRARVDVHRKESVGALEKAITVYGNPENCTNACKRILEVMQQEAESTNKGEISLKILAHNNLIGRIIGKGGSTIKRVMQDTDTKITVSSLSDVSSFNMERVISIKGSIENMSKAEALISAKLRQSYESDLQAAAPHGMMYPGLHPMAVMSTPGMGYVRGPHPTVFPTGVPNSYPPGTFPPGMVPLVGTEQETAYLYIPNSAVGAVIGSKGSHIRNVIRYSGASVKIASLPEGASAEPQTERRVTIIGTPDAQWKAQYLIFEKLREEGFMPAGEDVRLTVELLVPSSQVGRIIGKGGQNVRELQRTTSSIIKLPEQSASSGDETTVHIIGNFYAVQSAQRRIRAMLSQQNTPGRSVGEGLVGHGRDQQ